MSSVPADRRYRSGRRCPICHGADGDPRGKERRCFGFLSDDGLYAHCSREEHAGALKLSDGSQTYGHRLTGPCACGTQHAEAPAPEQRRIVATYDYRDESGALVYQVVRYEPKTFRQRRPDPAQPDRWLWNLEDTRRVLYHLDRVLEAAPTQTIYIVEGEKDVEALETLGLVATCNPQGAGKWSAVMDCAAAALAGRDVVVIADADDRGRKHATDVVGNLSPITASIRSIELPGAKDSADWVRNGGTAEQLAALKDLPPIPASIDAAALFQRNEDGKIYHSQYNIKLALAKLGVRIRYNVFSRRRIVDGLQAFGPRLNDDALNHLRLRIDEEHHFRPSKEFFHDVVVDHAFSNRFHPVRDYLDGLKWDGTPRLDDWLAQYAGAESTRYTRAIGALVLIAAVRRVRKPGCKFDEMLILEGEQGKFKSTALGILAVEQDWFTDELPLTADDTRKMIECTVGRWIVEAGELRGMSKGDAHALKQYLGRTEDKARLAYGREIDEFQRQFIIIGTTNEVRGSYLKDTTGNRRFWPVTVQSFDLEALRRDRDQLWAEAARREATGASIRLDPSLYGDAAVEQEERRAEDPIDIVVRRAFGDYTGRIPITDAWGVLGINGRVLTQDEMTRFGNAMRAIGWDRTRARLGGEKPYVYSKGDADQSKRWITVRSGHVEPV